MQPHPPQIDTGALHHSQLTAGADIDAEPLLAHPAGHRRTEKRLGGVVDIPALEGIGERAGSRPQVGFIHHVDRSADLFGNLDDAEAGHREHASSRPCRTPVLHRLGSRALTSLGMLSQLGARAAESAWIEPATWVCVTSRNCARPGRTGADLSARGHRERPFSYDDAVMSMMRLVC